MIAALALCILVSGVFDVSANRLHRTEIDGILVLDRQYQADKDKHRRHHEHLPLIESLQKQKRSLEVWEPSAKKYQFGAFKHHTNVNQSLQSNASIPGLQEDTLQSHAPVAGGLLEEVTRFATVVPAAKGWGRWMQSFVSFCVASVVILLLAMACLAMHGSKSTAPKLANMQKAYSTDGKVAVAWAQDDSTTTMVLDSPDGVNKTNLEILISHDGIQIGRTGKKRPFFRQILWQKVDPDNSSWKLKRNGRIEVLFVKAKRERWESLFRYPSRSFIHRGGNPTSVADRAISPTSFAN